jgi:hypothetical protein
MRTIACRVSVLTMLVTLLSSSVMAEEPQTPQQWIDHFTAQWDEAAWKRGRGYMRPLDDEGWKTRMLAMQALVASGDASVKPLLAALKDGDTPRRLLAAQTLGYLGPNVSTDALTASLKGDPDAAVRLYAVDALGMQGGRDLSGVLSGRQKAEKNRDTRKHVAYALERKGKPVAEDVVKTLKAWDARTIDTAKLGKPAPDFELKTVSGKTIKLSQFHGKKPVVLVFIYGDT